MPPGRQLTAVMPLFALLGGRSRSVGKQYHRYRNQSGECTYPSGFVGWNATSLRSYRQPPNNPDQAVETLAIAARNERGDFLEEPIPPCGACRQVMLETEKRFKRPMRILLSGEKGIYELRSVGALLPLSFDASSML